MLLTLLTIGLMADASGTLNSIDWQGWLNGLGLPIVLLGLLLRRNFIVGSFYEEQRARAERLEEKLEALNSTIQTDFFSAIAAANSGIEKSSAALTASTVAMTATAEINQKLLLVIDRLTRPPT